MHVNALLTRVYEVLRTLCGSMGKVADEVEEEEDDAVEPHEAPCHVLWQSVITCSLEQIPLRLLSILSSLHLLR